MDFYRIYISVSFIFFLFRALSGVSTIFSGAMIIGTVRPV